MNLHRSFSSVTQHTILSDSNGNLLSCGKHIFGTLGRHVDPYNEHTERILLPVDLIPPHEIVVAVSQGNTTSMALTETGQVYRWGDPQHQPENPDPSYYGKYHVPFNEAVTSITCGWDYDLVVTKSGTVFSWGAPDYGALGRPGPSTVPLPVNIPGEVVSVASGSAHVLALTKSGDLYGWGWNEQYMQLGIDNSKNIPEPEKLNLGINVADMVCGMGYSILLDKNGVLHGFGNSPDGELLTVSAKPTLPAPLPLPKKVTHVATGYNHTLALCEDGTLWTWGEQSVRMNKSKPREVIIWEEEECGMLVDSRGEIESGERDKGVMIEVAAIMCGLDTSFVESKTGKIFAWGSNSSSQLCFGTNAVIIDVPRKIPGVFRLPWELDLKQKWEWVMCWLYLGRSDSRSYLWGLPMEVLYHASGILKNLNESY
jgi:alpha-tubulin suppressor-like RCC1 family protein